MRRYHVELTATTTGYVTVEADCPHDAFDAAEEQAYDMVHEVDRATWRAVSVEELPS